MSHREQNLSRGEEGADNDLSRAGGSQASQNHLPPKKRFVNQNVTSCEEGPTLNEESKAEESKKVTIHTAGCYKIHLPSL